MGGDDLTGSSLSDSEKVRIASDFIKHAPPGEFNEVFNSLRMLLSDDRLLSNGCASAFADYNRDQFAPVRVDGAEKQTLITRFNDLGGGRFADPVEKNSFHYDHLGKTANDVAPLPELDSNTERWRHALQHELEAYIDAHYQKAGVGVVFVQGNTITIAIESHQFQPKNYWNGRWRSTWTIPVGDGKSGFQELKGNIKVQVHYYEDGNVQLFSDHEITAKVQVTADYEKTAKDVLDVISAEETKYQAAVQENYATMSETTFKALRRQLPVTRAKMDWAKLPTYRVAQDLRPQ